MTYQSVTKLHTLFNNDLDASRQEMFDALGDISSLEIWGSQVLLGVYCRPVETKGRFLVGNDVSVEDVWQGSVGMILKLGPLAFAEDASEFGGRKPEVGDWVYHDVNTMILQKSIAGPGSKKTMITAPNGTAEETRKWEGWPVRILESRQIIGRIGLPEILV